jgi:hypothetical protein
MSEALRLQDFSTLNDFFIAVKTRLGHRQRLNVIVSLLMEKYWV